MKETDIREQDYEEGLVGESHVFDILRNKEFSVHKPKDKYCWYDSNLNSNYLCEVKKRNNAKDQYQTTIIPYSKIQEYRKVKRNYNDLVFIFSFTDGNWYTTYNELINLVRKNVTIRIESFTRYSGFQHAARKHVHIPVELLKPLDQLVLE